MLRLVPVFTRAFHWPPPWAKWIQSAPSISLRSSLILSCDWLQTGFGLIIAFTEFLYNLLIHYTVLSYTHKHYCPQPRLHCRCLIAASKGGPSPYSAFPNCPRPQLPASHSNNSQQLNPSRYLTDWLTNQLTASACNISTRTAQKTLFLCCCLPAAA
jgi:hypothetical protein